MKKAYSFSIDENLLEASLKHIVKYEKQKRPYINEDHLNRSKCLELILEYFYQKEVKK